MPRAKNILFLMTDQHRPDYVGYAPDARVATPNLDRIAEGTAFTNCISVAPFCTPARTAILTGRYAHQVGMQSMSGDLHPGYPTYLQALRRAGYHTTGIGKFHWLQGWPWGQPTGKGHDLVALRETMKGYGLDAIWETAGKQLTIHNYCEFAAHLDRKGLLQAYYDFVHGCGGNAFLPHAEISQFTAAWPFDEADHVDILTADRIIRAIIERPTDRPFCIFGSFCSPHRPFDPPQRYLEQVLYAEVDDFIPGDQQLTDAQKRDLYRLRRYYAALVRLVDDQVGRIFAALETHGLLDDTVIFFTSDHGEMLGDHYRLEKGSPYRPSVGVPAAIRHPDYLRGGTAVAPIEITDLTATMLDVAGLDPVVALSVPWPAFNDAIRCRSLLPVLRGDTDRVRDFAFAESAMLRRCGDEYRSLLWQMIQTERWKYVCYIDRQGTPERYRHEELFDLDHDPRECTNLADRPELWDVLEACRRRRDFVLDTTPTGQTRWAPIIA